MPSIRLLTSGGLACWLVITAAPWINAQERTQVEIKRGGTAAVRRMSAMIGAKVSIQGNVSAGKVDDLIINENGCIDYLVVLNEEKYVLVPWDAATVDFERRFVTMEIQKEKFREVPTFTRDRWPDLSDTVYVEKLRTYYPVRPGRERRIERRDRREP